jgi:SAM-dependent methyltransferase
MYLDVVELRRFYLSALGTVARRLISRKLRQRWPDLSRQTVIGFGYASPFLGIFRAEAERLGALMPAEQGVVQWPSLPPYRSALVEERELPLADASVDRLLIVHAVENTAALGVLLREAWRVLKGEGKLIVVVPNRRGLWARVDTTPFGNGRPYSRDQLNRLLGDAMFTPQGWDSALHVPPFDLGFLVRSGMAWERIGARLWPGFAGVLIVEASKQMFAPVAKGKKRRAMVLRPALSQLGNAGRTANARRSRF